MTDNDIIKALECCGGETYEEDCPKCPMYSSGNCNCLLAKYALDLINRYKAKNERLKTQNSTIASRIYNVGIKDFAERLCDGRVSNDPVAIAAKCLLREMTEETP